MKRLAIGTLALGLGCATPQEVLKPTHDAPKSAPATSSSESAMHISEQIGHAVIKAIASLPSPVSCSRLASAVIEILESKGGKNPPVHPRAGEFGMPKTYLFPDNVVVETDVVFLEAENPRGLQVEVFKKGSEQDPAGILNATFSKFCSPE